MKILHLTSSYPRGPGDPQGAFVADSVALLRQAGHEVELRHCTLETEATILQQIRRRPWQTPWLTAQVLQAVKDGHNFDRVLCHWAWPFPQTARLRSIPRDRLRVWCHGSGLRLLHQYGLEGLMPQVPTAIVAEHQRCFLPRRLQDDAPIVPAPLHPDFPSRHGAVEPKLIFVGRLCWSKGADLLPRILDALPGWTAVAVGWGPLGRILNSDPRIQWLGAVSSPLWAERVGRGVAVIPSRIPEGAPRVLREFRSLGLPIVARRIRGLEEPIMAAGLGALVARDEPRTWAEACRHVQTWRPAPWKETGVGSDFLEFTTG